MVENYRAFKLSKLWTTSIWLFALLMAGLAYIVLTPLMRVPGPDNDSLPGERMIYNFFFLFPLVIVSGMFGLVAIPPFITFWKFPILNRSKKSRFLPKPY